VKLVVLMVLLATATASAQPATTQPSTTTQPTEVKASEDGKSQRLAFAMSFGLTTAGMATLFVTGSLSQPDEYGRTLRSEYKLPLYLTAGVLLAVGPSSGHIYAGEYWNGATTVRVVSGGLMVLAGAAIDDGSHNGNEGAAVVTVASAIVFLGASLYECGTAPRAVRRYNARHAGSAVTIVPVVSREPGLALVGQF
jgi:hypothetical protein